MSSRRGSARMRTLLSGCVVAAALLSIPAVASASTKGFDVKNDSRYTLRLSTVFPDHGICETLDCFEGGRPKKDAEMKPGASERWELYAPVFGWTGAWIHYDVFLGSPERGDRVSTARIAIGYRFGWGERGMYSECLYVSTPSRVECHADGWTFFTNQVTFSDGPHPRGAPEMRGRQLQRHRPGEAFRR